MSQYLRNRARKHKVTHEYSKKRHYFKVKTTTDEHNVTLELNCNCKYMGVRGVSKGKICSHIMAVFLDVWTKGLVANEKERMFEPRKAKQSKSK